MNKTNQEIIEEFRRRIDDENCKDTLLITDRLGALLSYPESAYEIDLHKMETFLLKTLEAKDAEHKKEIERIKDSEDWAMDER